MIGYRDFEMRDTVGREDLQGHPVWAPFRGSADREMILGWGVAPEQIEREIERFAYCGTEPMFPVLAFDPLPEIVGVVLAAVFTAADGRELEGYVIGNRAFGVFAAECEFPFNRGLGEAAGRTAGRLAAAMDPVAGSLFPLRYRTGILAVDGEEIAGEIEAFWT